MQLHRRPSFSFLSQQPEEKPFPYSFLFFRIQDENQEKCCRLPSAFVFRLSSEKMLSPLLLLPGYPMTFILSELHPGRRFSDFLIMVSCIASLTSPKPRTAEESTRRRKEPIRSLLITRTRHWLWSRRDSCARDVALRRITYSPYHRTSTR